MPRSRAARSIPSCQARARPGAARSQRTPKKTSTSQSCSKVSTPQARHWSSQRPYASAVAGALYALGPALLKLTRGVHEVISTIMLNWVAVSLVENWLVVGPLQAQATGDNSIAGTAQIWDSEKGAWKVNRFNYSFVGYIGRAAGHPDLVVAVRIEEGTPTVVRLGHLEMPVMSFELFRRIAHNAINTPYLLPEGQVEAPGEQVDMPVATAEP